jgi:hypothetical protein
MCRPQQRSARRREEAAHLAEPQGARAQRNAHGIAHITSGPEADHAAKKLNGAVHALLHRRVDTSLYVRNVAGVAGQASIVKNAATEKGKAQAVVTEAGGGGRAGLKDPRLLAR